jgi:hypothetical protein
VGEYPSAPHIPGGGWRIRAWNIPRVFAFPIGVITAWKRLATSHSEDDVDTFVPPLLTWTVEAYRKLVGKRPLPQKSMALSNM